LIDQLLTTIILGLIQGFAEWLPISSTAHLRVAEHFLGFQATPLFNVFLHVGTLGVVIFYFRHDIKVILTALVHRDFHSEYGRFIPLIVVATIPTGIIGLLYDASLADNYQTLLIIGVTFIVGAALLFASKYGKENQTQITYRKALVMGFAQGAASFPGLSRSGSTISGGLLQGVKREMVFKFVGVNPIDLLVGLAITAVAGYLAIVLVKKLVLTKRFHYFAAYTFTLGVILIALALLGF